MSLKTSNICIFFTQSRKIYTWQKTFTQAPPVVPVTYMRYAPLSPRLLLLFIIISRGRLFANDHPDRLVFCNWSPRGAGFFEINIGMGRPFANDHLDGPAFCKWSSRFHYFTLSFYFQTFLVQCILVYHQVKERPHWLETIPWGERLNPQKAAKQSCKNKLHLEVVEALPLGLPKTRAIVWSERSGGAEPPWTTPRWSGSPNSVLKGKSFIPVLLWMKFLIMDESDNSYPQVQ